LQQNNTIYLRPVFPSLTESTLDGRHYWGKKNETFHLDWPESNIWFLENYTSTSSEGEAEAKVTLKRQERKIHERVKNMENRPLQEL
jgi:hypothetical protein